MGRTRATPILRNLSTLLPMRDGEMEQEGGKPGRFEESSEAIIGACIEVQRQSLLRNGSETAHAISYFPASRLPVNLSGPPDRETRETVRPLAGPPGRLDRA